MIQSRSATRTRRSIHAAALLVAAACLLLAVAMVDRPLQSAPADGEGRGLGLETESISDNGGVRPYAPATDVPADTTTAAPPDMTPAAVPVTVTGSDPAAPLETHRPAIRLTGERVPDLLEQVLAVDGVTVAARIDVVIAPLDVGEEPLSIALVDPREFRSLVPQVTADAHGVWQRIREGDAALTHDVGHELDTEHGIALGERVGLAGGDETLRIGAYASNGIPPVAQAIVSRETGVEIGLEGDPELLVAVDEGASPEAVLEAIETATGVSGEVIPAPEERRAFLTGTASRDAFEPFTYVSLGDGMIQIDEDWVRRNIVRAEVPVLRGEVVCHRLLIPQLRGALQEIADEGLGHLIDPSDYGGCWSPRHILFDPSRGLSMHAWGVAIDFNVATNQYGAEPQMDQRIVDIFERWGFAWGGHWRTPDGMHFELAALLDPDG